jgi:hypothetical protein
MAAMGSITTSLPASPSDFGSQTILALRTLSVFCVRDLLRGEGNGSCSGEGAGELGEDGQVGMKLDALKATDSERQ